MNQARTIAVGTSRIRVSKLAQLAATVLLGAAVVYGAGFANSASLHSAAHDMRHAAGFPCH